MRQLVYIMFISNNHPSFHLWLKKNLVKHLKVSKYYETDCRRPNLMFEEEQTKAIWICDMAFPRENKIEKKRLKKRTSYRQLGFEIRKKIPEFKVKVELLVTSAFGGCVKDLLN